MQACDPRDFFVFLILFAWLNYIDALKGKKTIKLAQEGFFIFLIFMNIYVMELPLK
jgi:hypothetical protein